MQAYIVHYGELSLKGKNRHVFEKQLVRNLRDVLRDLGDVQVGRFHSHIIARLPDEVAAETVEARLRRVFGIAYLAPTLVVARDIDTIAEAALGLAEGSITAETSFAVDTRRGDKRYPIQSPEVNRRIGALIGEATGAPVNLRHPDVKLTIQIYEDAAYLFIRRIPGAGGLPVGVSGRVLALFSGGIDSPVAAHLLLKRGCTLDFLHFHLLPRSVDWREVKIVEMAKATLGPQQATGHLYMASAAPFEMALVDLDTRVATVVFRRFIMRVAERIAQRQEALALVTGESVGQVASQTLQNIQLIAGATTLPIFRPLIGLDKAEIIELAQAIDTYELSIQPYKDPCSMHARRPATWASLENVLEIEEKIGVDALVLETLNEHLEIIKIG